MLYILSYSDVCCTDRATVMCVVTDRARTATCAVQTSLIDVRCVVQTNKQQCAMDKVTYNEVCCTDCQQSVLYRLSYSDVCCIDELH